MMLDNAAAMLAVRPPSVNGLCGRVNRDGMAAREGYNSHVGNDVMLEVVVPVGSEHQPGICS
jgi:hypothetical protein